MIPRARMVHTKIWHSDQFCKLSVSERLLYIAMVTLADDTGLMRGDARYLSKYIFFCDRYSDKRVEKMRDHIAEVGLIHVYSDDAGTYICHPKWNKYQTLRKDRIRDSEYPLPPDDIGLTNVRQVTAQVKVSEVEGNGSEPLREERGSQGSDAFSPREAMLRGMPDGGERSVFNRSKGEDTDLPF